MASNNADQVVFDKVAEINASKESWNIRVKLVMLWKPTYINNPNMVASLDMILIDQEVLFLHTLFFRLSNSYVISIQKNFNSIFVMLFYFYSYNFNNQLYYF